MHEWAAVCWFYSAYQLMVAVIRDDPIFENVSRLQRVHAQLVPDDRYSERHKGRVQRGGPRQWGVNDLVVALYDHDIAGAYDKLHNASVEVRYQNGLRTPLDRVREWLGLVATAHEIGRLVCSREPDEA